ncbi:hypothetical protein IAQ61_009394 [Plenodomus lingam]|uniref:Uncharacterized protein n=1 Tax=Leptosphaeria maculans (strain JN3 / isolate v23.1.3 / race Av1-4-5-6-7-8) TaxID=985895 RepID=E4ZU04_LEPMJ|nr:hypothetical protein LEMA_P117170.1 [Plenodomus lingam JN3]KAH9863117.1 hypothetical protein IAQ61_009394 [Plenodomus lingam]CBX94714.1 hypothetical protein LEMA_P117170.1 [Plenodomus lingam JN3]
MASNYRLLLSQLPPELRIEIYSYLSTKDTTCTPTARFLPFQLKYYECKHTSITITPVHHGSNSLLALQPYRFLEAHEYHAWLKANAVQLNIKVVFKGKVGTFVHDNWVKKVESHLQKLIKQHPWLGKVADYHIQIHWDASDGVLKGRKKKPTGQIPRDMAKALTMLMDEKVKKKQGCVKVRLLLAHRIAVEHVFFGTRFGLGVFLAVPAMDEGAKEFTMEAWKTRHLDVSKDGDKIAHPASAVEKGGKALAVVDASRREFDIGASHLFMKKTIKKGETIESIWGDVQFEGGVGPDRVLVELMDDCHGK